jgi:hypothetical protein
MTVEQPEDLPGHAAVPGGRIAGARGAAAQAQPDPVAVAVAQAAAAGQAPAMAPVPVRGAEPLATINAAAAEGRYFTVVLPASTVLAPGVRPILPRDDSRVCAWILPIDGPIIVATSLEQAQDPTNVGGIYPSGQYMPAGGYPVTHREPMWACNPSTTSTCRVSVMVETGGAA